ncbi:ferredoxin reductase [Sinimarinibacterium thermocellulolyticum]|uniref:Ferredoxin reductase n=1 Tax=Sinimarinibacterium thermocellulolyticum TaxID=3170016 RepID=A0ABV2A861_9GAMM
MAFDRLVVSALPTGRWLQRAAAALTWPLDPADYLGALRADAGAGNAVVERIEHPTPDAVTLTLRVPRGFLRHRPGQFVRLGVDIDGVRHTRCYSIASAPERGDGCIEITVKAIAGGRVSVHLKTRLVVGARVQLDAPAGDFVLPEQLPARMLFIAAGSGITPMMSILRSLDARGAVPQLTIVHCAPDAASMLYGDELAVLAARHPRITLHRIHTRSQGRFDVAQLDTLCRGWAQCETWACGPDAMLQQIEDHWQRYGIGERLHVERFRPRALRAVDAAAGRVQFVRSGRIADGRSDQPVLELAEQNGMAPAHGCRMGICHGCTATLKAGCVRDLRNGKTYSDEGDLVQICVCAPVGDVQIDL